MRLISREHQDRAAKNQRGDGEDRYRDRCCDEEKDDS